jgi:trans-aconitate methyltransferase
MRSSETELMDDGSVGLDEFRACLADLAKVNRLTLTHHPTLAWLKRAARGLAPGDTLGLLDVAFGHGDLLRAVHRWATRRGLRPDLAGVDLNPWSAVAAAEATPAGMTIDYATGDVFKYEPRRPVDFIVSSQFTHHLSDRDVIAFLRWVDGRARRGWFIVDLHRNALPFQVFRVVSHVAGWHSFVQHDGPVSIARSFRMEDWHRYVALAGLPVSEIEIRWHVPFRISASRIR